MGSEWQHQTLGDVLELKRGYDLPKKQRQAGDVPIISSAGVSDTHAEPKVKGPGVVTGRYGTIGKVFYCRRDFWPLNTTLYVKDFKGNDEKFIYYFLKTIDYKQYSDKAAVPGVNRNHLHMANVIVPKSVAEQKKIAHILGSLDDKIELNRQMNATLESMAQALFKSWFVDFDPVIDNALVAGNPIPAPLQARAETRQTLGNQRKPLPKAIQKQFPSRFVFSEEIGWTPEGWEVIPVTNIVDTISDTYPLKTVEKIIFLNTGDILDGKFSHNNYSKVVGLPGQAKKSIQYGDILFSEIRPKNKRYAFVDFDSSDYVVSTKLMVLRSTGRFNPLFPYFLLKQNETISYLQRVAESRSGTFPQITYTQLDQVKITIPTCDDLVEYFTSKILKVNHRRSKKIRSESSGLENIRDTLLPKLLSGQLRISDAEKQLADVI